jgi:hypothetical protein
VCGEERSTRGMINKRTPSPVVLGFTSLTRGRKEDRRDQQSQARRTGLSCLQEGLVYALTRAAGVRSGEEEPGRETWKITCGSLLKRILILFIELLPLNTIHNKMHLRHTATTVISGIE